MVNITPRPIYPWEITLEPIEVENGWSSVSEIGDFEERKFLSTLSTLFKELKCEDNAVHNCHKIIKTCPLFHPYIQWFQPATAAVDNSVISLLIHTCIHQRLMSYIKCSYAYYWSQRHCSTSLLRYDIQSMGQNLAVIHVPYISMYKNDFLFRRYVGRDSAVVVATRYGLDGPGIKSRWGGRFFALIQTGPGAHPASYTISTVS
jgi:hypothetical protein